MGYSTQYSLSVKKENVHLIDEFLQYSENADHALNSNGSTKNTCKWYEYHDELTEFSKKHPTVVFELSGSGEDGVDLWKRYYKNGKFQISPARILYDEFDESKLV